MFIFSLYFW